MAEDLADMSRAASRPPLLASIKSIDLFHHARQSLDWETPHSQIFWTALPLKLFPHCCARIELEQVGKFPGRKPGQN